MDVFGHEDVSVEEELVSAAEGFESTQENSSGVVVVEIAKAAVTTEGEEVEVSFGLESLEPARHRRILDSGSMVFFDPTHDDKTIMNGAPGTRHTVADDGTRLRVNSDGTARVDRPASVTGDQHETVHFNQPDKPQQP
jgi:hypothetical protein